MRIYQGTSIERVDTILKAYKSRGHVFELCTVILLSWGLLWLYFNWSTSGATQVIYWILPLLLLVLAGLSLRAAIKYSTKVAKGSDRLLRRTRYLLTPPRIDTLKQVRPEKDVETFLELLKKDLKADALTEKEVVWILKEGLGDERANQVKADVLKYTRVYVRTGSSAN